MRPPAVPFLDTETEFLNCLIELHHGEPVKEKLIQLSHLLPWAEGYPENPRSFWNAESFMWAHKIDSSHRQLITGQLYKILFSSKSTSSNSAYHLPSQQTQHSPKFQSISQKKRLPHPYTDVPDNHILPTLLHPQCSNFSTISSSSYHFNLDLGCGAYSYIPSIGFDMSPLMLKLNNRLIRRIEGNIEDPLPFADAEFDSVTAIFLLNYISSLNTVLAEIRRILTPGGKFIAVLSSNSINPIHAQHQINHLSPQTWKKLLETSFNTTLNIYGQLLFFTCTA